MEAPLCGTGKSVKLFITAAVVTDEPRRVKTVLRGLTPGPRHKPVTEKIKLQWAKGFQCIGKGRHESIIMKTDIISCIL